MVVLGKTGFICPNRCLCGFNKSFEDVSKCSTIQCGNKFFEAILSLSTPTLNSEFSNEEEAQS